MDSLTLWIVVTLVFWVVAGVALLITGVVFLIKRLGSHKSPETIELNLAQREYSQNLRRSERDLKKAESRWQSELTKAKKELVAAEMLPTVPLATYKGQVGNFVLRGETLEVAHGTFNLDENVHASVDTAGNLATKSRPTLTRMAAGGLLLGPVGILAGGMFKKSKSVDNRELYMMIEGTDFATLIQARPEDGPLLRQLAMSINNAARSVPAFKSSCQIAVDSARAQLHSVESDTTAIDAARVELERTKQNRARLDLAENVMANSLRKLEAGNTDTASV